MSIWWDGVVPFTVELGTFDVDGGHLGIRYDNALGVLAGVEFAAHGEAGFGGGSRDQLDDHAITDEWLGAPVLAAEGEQAVLDFVPLAGAGRQVADHDVEAELVGQLLQFAFPQPHPRAVAAAAIGGDQQSGCLGIARPTDGEPPLADAIDGERRRIMVDADTHPTTIGGQVIDPVRHCAAEFLDQEVVDTDLFRAALRTIFAPIVAEIPDQFLFLGVDGDHRLLFGQSAGHLGVDVAELRIPVGMAVALRGLAVALQAVPRLIEQVADQGAADLVTLRLQRLRQPAHALAGPPQRRSRITPRRRLDQRPEIVEQCRVLGSRRFASGSRPPDPLRRFVPRQFLQAPPDRARRNPGRQRDRRDPAITRSECLGRRDQTAAPFIEKRGHRGKSLSDRFDIDHHHNIWYSNYVVNPYVTLSKVDSIISGRTLTWSAVAVKLAPDRSLLPAETGRVLLQQLALRAPQARGVVFSHLLLQRTVCRRGQRHTGVDSVQLDGRLGPAFLSSDRGTSEAGQDGNRRACDRHMFIVRPPVISNRDDFGGALGAGGPPDKDASASVGRCISGRASITARRSSGGLHFD